MSEENTKSNSSSVAAIVVCHNRRETVGSVIEHLLGQTVHVAEIIVVDNNSADGTVEMVKAEYPEVTCLAMSENLGSAGGMVKGMKTAYAHGHDWLWLWEDDTTPAPDALEICLNAYRQLDDDTVGIVHPWANVRGKPSSRAWGWKAGYIPISPNENGDAYDVDVLCNTGNLVSRKVVEIAGYPREDYFMMWSEIAYGLRVKEAGFRIVALPKALYEHLKPETGKPYPPWRGYYQTRNQLAHALERRSIREILWWAKRQIRFNIHALIHYDSKLLRLKLRALGAWHGLRGQLGRTIDPAAFPQKK